MGGWGAGRAQAGDLLEDKKAAVKGAGVSPSNRSSLCKGPVSGRRELRSGKNQRESGAPLSQPATKWGGEGGRARQGFPQGLVAQGES